MLYLQAGEIAMEKICYKIAYWFYQHHMIEKEDINALRFAFELKITQLITHLTILVIGGIMDRFIETIVYCVVFIFLRKTIKGYHAETFHMCYLLTVLNYVVVMVCIEYTLPYGFISFFILLLTLCYFQEPEKRTIMFITIAYFGLLCVFYLCDNFYYINMFSLVYGIVLCMRLIGGNDDEDSGCR